MRCSQCGQEGVNVLTAGKDNHPCIPEAAAENNAKAKAKAKAKAAPAKAKAKAAPAKASDSPAKAAPANHTAQQLVDKHTRQELIDLGQALIASKTKREIADFIVADRDQQ